MDDALLSGGGGAFLGCTFLSVTATLRRAATFQTICTIANGALGVQSAPVRSVAGMDRNGSTPPHITVGWVEV